MTSTQTSSNEAGAASKTWRFEHHQPVTTLRKQSDGTWGYTCRWEGCSDLLSGGWNTWRFGYVAARQHAKGHLRGKVPIAYQKVKV